MSANLPASLQSPVLCTFSNSTLLNLIFGHKICLISIIQLIPIDVIDRFSPNIGRICNHLNYQSQSPQIFSNIIKFSAISSKSASHSSQTFIHIIQGRFPNFKILPKQNDRNKTTAQLYPLPKRQHTVERPYHFHILMPD